MRKPIKPKITTGEQSAELTTLQRIRNDLQHRLLYTGQFQKNTFAKATTVNVAANFFVAHDYLISLQC